MRLNENEFRMMNKRTKDILQKYIEFPIVRWLGLRDYNKEIFTILEHPREALFTGKEFAHELQKAGFIIHKKISLFGFNFFYAQKNKIKKST